MTDVDLDLVVASNGDPRAEGHNNERQHEHQNDGAAHSSSSEAGALTPSALHTPPPSRTPHDACPTSQA
jgi:hypothetical protein